MALLREEVGRDAENRSPGAGDQHPWPPRLGRDWTLQGLHGASRLEDRCSLYRYVGGFWNWSDGGCAPPLVSPGLPSQPSDGNSGHDHVFDGRPGNNLGLEFDARDAPRRQRHRERPAQSVTGLVALPLRLALRYENLPDISVRLLPSAQWAQRCGQVARQGLHLVGSAVVLGLASVVGELLGRSCEWILRPRSPSVVLRAAHHFFCELGGAWGA
mmetsp:Transcript_32347/g.69277  ORF Transcript_32347/g.69277 Transcript_32347/m.69277 type:complete len:215 (+) Transcript_32347:926-1570(+)